MHYRQRPMMSGHDGADPMALGMTLGELRQGQSQIIQAVQMQTGVLHAIHGQLEENGKRMAQMQAQPHPSSDRLSLREKLYLAWAALVLIGAALGKSTFQEAMQMLARPPGM